MKKILHVAVVFLFFVTLNAQGQSNVEKIISEKNEQLQKAMVEADAKKLNELTSKELTYGHSNALIEDKAAYIAAIVNKASVFTSIKTSDQTIQVLGDVAVVRHRLQGDTNNNDVPAKVDLNVLLVWKKESGNWKLLARQATKTPQ